MTLESLRRGYERVLRKRFPTVIVVADPTDRSPHWPPYLHIHCLPPDRMAEYAAYSLGELDADLKAAGLPDAHMFPCSETQTRLHYPGVCTHGKRRARSTRSLTRRSSRGRQVTGRA